jgi:hypothetical protein
VHPTAARFPDVPAGAGHYESFYLKACHPGEPRGLWIRYTVHKRPHAVPTGSLWFTCFDAAGGAPRAGKLTVAAPAAGEGDWIRVGEAVMRAGAARGGVEGVDWDLSFESDEAPLLHLPSEWMYGARLPKTKLLSPLPAARFFGRVTVDGRALELDGWRGMIGHNWGAQHAERWIWLHGLTEAGDWLDAAIGRIALGPLTTPWVANGALSLGRARHALGGPGRRAQVRERPDRCEFVLPGRDLRVRGEVEADAENFVGWLYADPDGGEHHAVNCSIADMRLQIERKGEPDRELAVRGGAAYELGMRERDHGVPIQPFPDG